MEKEQSHEASSEKRFWKIIGVSVLALVGIDVLLS